MNRIIKRLLILQYFIVVFYITCCSRSPSILSQVAPYPFWSYVQALYGNANLALEILENILLFIPLSFLLKQNGCSKRRIVIGCFAFSIFIELVQLIFHLGLFEFDDILDNTIGAFIGIVIYKELKVSDIKKTFLSGIGVICSVIFCFTMSTIEGVSSEKEFFFEIELCNVTNEKLSLYGCCFLYEKPDEGYTLFLQSDEVVLQTTTNIFLPSEDINTYYFCDEDYSNQGFFATADIDATTIYEIKVKWDNGIISPTGVYIKNGEITYSLADTLDYPATLLVSESEHDFYVYQNGVYLYWLCGDKFPFEDDGSAYVQYQLWTTQTENLPVYRLENSWLWDNIGFNFEDYEIESWNGYRVARKAIPTEYSITAIVTGYYKKDKWIWKNYFRPIVFDIPGFPNVR